ncbi:hypothetical protein H6F89_08150 [Cyanobacteria bacterium FACHB-63]|nr:hypothetical protein [Cyanobacteria bacterium FACHB-63]
MYCPLKSVAQSHEHADLEVIECIPAAGQANRLPPLPASKELYPLGFRTNAAISVRPKGYPDIEPD